MSSPVLMVVASCMAPSPNICCVLVLSLPDTVHHADRESSLTTRNGGAILTDHTYLLSPHCF